MQKIAEPNVGKVFISKNLTDGYFTRQRIKKYFRKPPKWYVYMYGETTEKLIGYTVLRFQLGYTISLICTVEPPNKGHVGTRHFVLCREVVFSVERLPSF